MAFSSQVLQVTDEGNPQPSYRLAWQDTTGGGIPTYAARNFGIAKAATAEFTCDWRVNAVDSRSRVGFGIFRDSAGSGIAVVIEGAFGAWSVGVGSASSWAQYGGMAEVTTGLIGLAVDTWFRIFITATANADGSTTATATVRTTADVDIGSVTATISVDRGDYCGFYSTFDQLGGTSLAWLDNINVKASGSLGVTITNIATSYVYTFVNNIGEESAPSLPSSTILRPDGVSVTVTTPQGEPTGVSGDYLIQTKRIYRSATGSSGTAFRFVAEIPLSQADYVDTLTDSDLGEVLQSDNWALPPDDLEGILALPNGVMVGFSKNQLCFSAQNFPHAWPVEYRLNTDTDIVGIGNIDTTVVIGTKSFLYVATGNDPAHYSMSKFEVPHAASSKLSFSYITGLGVIFSGPQGLMAVSGVGQVKNLTEGVFTLRQWRALNPSSIVSVAHDDIYFMFWEAGSERGCYAVDLRPEGFGIVEMAFHACAAYVDPIEDKMYLVLDYDNEPDDPLLPVPPALPVYIDSRTIYEFEGSPTELMTYSWRTKLWLEPYPAFHEIAQVRAETYANLIARFYGDGVLLDSIVIEGETEFTLSPPDEAYQTFEMELVGTDTVRVLQAGDDVTELG